LLEIGELIFVGVGTGIVDLRLFTAVSLLLCLLLLGGGGNVEFVLL
jgi:hypothetical protein